MRRAVECGANGVAAGAHGLPRGVLTVPADLLHFAGFTGGHLGRDQLHGAQRVLGVGPHDLSGGVQHLEAHVARPMTEADACRAGVFEQERPQGAFARAQGDRPAEVGRVGLGQGLRLAGQRGRAGHARPGGGFGRRGGLRHRSGRAARRRNSCRRARAGHVLHHARRQARFPQPTHQGQAVHGAQAAHANAAARFVKFAVLQGFQAAQQRKDRVQLRARKAGRIRGNRSRSRGHRGHRSGRQ